jgi:hypothetical protein
MIEVTIAGLLTEKIMEIFWKEDRPICVPKLEVEAYNRVYEHVLKTLQVVKDSLITGIKL